MDAEWLVACFCAEWCGACREYRPGLEALARDFPDAAFIYVDIEDEADLAGDYDVEDFPTILVQRGDRVLLYGTMLPIHEHLKRALESLKEDPPRATVAVPDFRAALRAARGGG